MRISRWTCRAALLGRQFSAPIFAAPIGALKLHYGDKHDDLSYNNILVPACAGEGIAAFTGDGTDPRVFEGACARDPGQRRRGDPHRQTLGPGTPSSASWRWPRPPAPPPSPWTSTRRACPFLQNLTPPAGSKTVEELREVAAACGDLPFILKGIMTVRGAEKAAAAGAKAIVVLQPRRPVLDQCPATAEVLPTIVDAVGKDLTVLVDGGIRTGMDVFKALALGARGVLIGRPFVPALYGGGAEGGGLYIRRLKAELADTMAMCGVHSLPEINRSCVTRFK